MKLLEYEIDDKLYESNISLVYRAKRKSDKQSVILKILNEEYPSNNQLTRFKYEYEILKMFNSDKVIKVYNLEKIENSVAIIEEDFKGQSLNLYNWKSLSLETILKLFIKTVECIEEIHSHNIIHKDISPSNILWNSHANEVKIIDFGIATKLLHEKSEIINANTLEGKLAYISPEQTGRMNRNIDYRSDFYSLGATFYEILTSKQPFINAKDEMELIYCHLAKEPNLPHEINDKIPIAVSKIIQKLMAKNAEDRYQSIFGLKFDLEECLNQLEKNGVIDDFSLCKKDQLSKFQIPQKLYGRQKDIEVLMKGFENICNGKNELILVSGLSGIGKSVLINEIHRPIIQQKGYFISGKYDQFQKDIPYRAIVNSFRELIQQLLTESNEKIIFWKEKFTKNLGLNGQVIIDIIPELELIIGKQEPVPALPPNESQNRFNLVFQNFIHTLATKDHPLVIFLDDLQWADSSSLKLIETLLCSQEIGYFLIIGAYRDNEVNEIHPLSLTISNIKNEEILINRIKLEPLKIEDINELIMDSFNCSADKGFSLAKLIFTKTEGNPFFINELLNFLYVENLITFDYSLLEWKWELKKIQDMGVTDNIIELMTKKIKKLSHQAQETLKFSACIGNTFDIRKLLIVCQKSKAEIISDLWEILESYMIFPLNDSYRYMTDLDELNMIYKFSHDRIQQAAYSLISDEEKKEFHLKIGKLLVANFSRKEQLDQVFDIVNHLNFAKDLIRTESEVIELAYFNLIASQKSKKSIAYTSAFNYPHCIIKCNQGINKNAS